MIAADLTGAASAILDIYIAYRAQMATDQQAKEAAIMDLRDRWFAGDAVLKQAFAAVDAQTAKAAANDRAPDDDGA